MNPPFADQSAEVTEFMRMIEPEPEHSLQVARLSTELFHSLNGGTQDDLFLLHSAALLHDIGWTLCPEGRGHHKASAQLIREHTWKLLESDHIAQIALLARYHRKAEPDSRHERFRSLAKNDQLRILRLSGILRVADALDRSHRQLVHEVRVHTGPDRIELIITNSGDGLDEEKAAVEKKAGLFRRVFNRPLFLTLNVNKKGLA